MNHFASDAATRRLDELALRCMDRLDPEALYETCRRRHITMCGMIPAVIVLERCAGSANCIGQSASPMRRARIRRDSRSAWWGTPGWCLEIRKRIE